MGDFVSSTQLASFLQADLDSASADLCIQMAEGLVRAHCRQTLSEATSTGALVPIVLTDSGFRVSLPERPVSAVSAVSVNGVTYTEGVDYAWDGGSPVVWLAEVESSADDFETWPLASVTYTHGYAAIPDDIVAVTLSAASRFYDNPRGMRSESVEGYTYTRGGAGDDILGATLSSSEKQMLNKYRRQAGTVVVS